MLQGKQVHQLTYILRSLQMHQRKMGCSLRGTHCKGNLVPSRSKLYITIWNKGSLLALKEFKDLCLNIFAVIPTDNRTVLTMENPDLVLQETGDSSPTHPRWLNVIADKLSRLGQTRQNRQRVPPVRGLPRNMLLVHQPQVDLFLPPSSATNCLNLYYWCQTPNMDSDAISLPWEDLDPYAFPLLAILGKWWRSCRITNAGVSF